MVGDSRLLVVVVVVDGCTCTGDVCTCTVEVAPLTSTTIFGLLSATLATNSLVKDAKAGEVGSFIAVIVVATVSAFKNEDLSSVI